MQSKISTILLGALLALPLAAAGSTCAVSACLTTIDEQGDRGREPCTDGNYALRAIVLQVEGDVGGRLALYNDCGGGEQPDGGSYHYRGISQGAVVWAPELGAWGAGGQWSSEDKESPGGTEEHSCRVEYYPPLVGVDKPCPLGQRPPMLLPALP